MNTWNLFVDIWFWKSVPLIFKIQFAPIFFFDKMISYFPLKYGVNLGKVREYTEHLASDELVKETMC